MTRIWNFVAALVQDVNGDESQEILAAPIPSPSSDHQITKFQTQKMTKQNLKLVHKNNTQMYFQLFCFVLFCFFEVGD